MSEVADSFNKETLIWEKEPLLYRIAYYLYYSLLLTLSETGVSPTALSTPCISYTVIKFSLIGLAGWDLFYSYKMTFLRKRGVIFRELVTHTHKKSFICILLKYCYIPHNKNLMLTPNLFVRPMMWFLWRHY